MSRVNDQKCTLYWLGFHDLWLFWKRNGIPLRRRTKGGHLFQCITARLSDSQKYISRVPCSYLGCISWVRKEWSYCLDARCRPQHQNKSLNQKKSDIWDLNYNLVFRADSWFLFSYSHLDLVVIQLTDYACCCKLDRIPRMSSVVSLWVCCVFSPTLLLLLHEAHLCMGSWILSLPLPHKPLHRSCACIDQSQ